MSKTVGGMLALGVLLLGVAAGRAGDDKDAMVDNPKFRFWANFKAGATSTYAETTKMTGAEAAKVPGGVDRKTITYKLANVGADKVVVVTVVVEEDFLGTLESAPTRLTFPAKVKKANVAAFLQEWSVTEGKEETVKVGDKEIMCKVRAGTQKVEGGMVEFKICYSDTVPGGVVRRTRTTKEGDKVVAETTITLLQFAESKKKKSDQ